MVTRYTQQEVDVGKYFNMFFVLVSRQEEFISI